MELEPWRLEVGGCGQRRRLLFIELPRNIGSEELSIQIAIGRCLGGVSVAIPIG
jgi:hypothetical protein